MPQTPLPGQPVRGSRSGRPLMAALDLLGRRWALRVLWEMRDGPVGARALLARSEGLSSSVMYERLRELGGAGLIGRNATGAYQLTSIGRELARAIEPLSQWADTWADQTRALELCSLIPGFPMVQNGGHGRASRAGDRTGPSSAADRDGGRPGGDRRADRG
jgi:DNA-binding HxlR family transcriptional regulator